MNEKRTHALMRSVGKNRAACLGSWGVGGGGVVLHVIPGNVAGTATPVGRVRLDHWKNEGHERTKAVSVMADRGSPHKGLGAHWSPSG